MDDELAGRVARNVRELRIARGLTQHQMARLSGLPRATWSNLESGAANPTLSVLHKASLALQITLEELISAPKAAARFYPSGSLPVRRRGQATFSSLLPDHIPGVEIDRLALPPRGQLTGVPHTDGTREYLACDSGMLVLTVAGERFTLSPGDVVVFRGDQKHGYANPGDALAVGYSVVLQAVSR